MKRIAKGIHEYRDWIVPFLVLIFIFLLPPIMNLSLRFLKGTQWHSLSRVLFTDLVVLTAVLFLWRKWIRSRESIILLGMLLFIQVSLFYSEAPTSSMAGEYLKFSTACGLFFFLAFSSSWADSNKLLFFVVWCMAIFGMGEAIWALLQYLSQGDLGLGFLGERHFGKEISGTAIIHVGNDILVRSYGNFDHPNALGGFLVLSILTSCSLFWQSGNRWIRVFLAIGLCLQGLALIMTYSRSAWLGISLGVTVWLIQLYFRLKGKFKEKLRHLRSLFVIILLLFSICCLCFPKDILRRLGFVGRESNVELTMQIKECFTLDEGRRTYQEIAERMIDKRPFTGIGFNGFVKQMDGFLTQGENAKDHLPVHNIYYLLAAETGLPSLILFGLFLLMLLRGIKEEPLSPFIAILMAFLLIGCFDNYFFTMQAGRLMFFTVCGGIILQKLSLQRLPSRREIALA